MAASTKRYGIVVGVDGSPASNFAVCWAARDAAMRHIPLTLVHMLHPFVPAWPEMPLFDDAVVWREDDGRRVLDEAVKIAEDATKTCRRIEISSGLVHLPPVPAVAEMAEEGE